MTIADTLREEARWALRILVAAIFSPVWLPLLAVLATLWGLANIVAGLCSFVIEGHWSWLND